jgi:hypothetical protein
LAGGGIMTDKLSRAQEILLEVIDRFDPEDEDRLDLVRPGDIRTAMSLEKRGLVRTWPGLREGGQPCVFVERVQ